MQDTENPFLKGFSSEKTWNENTDAKALIFYHIPKCAGTSFTDILQKSFTNSYRFHSYTDWSKNYSPTEREISISGHSSLGAHELFSNFAPYYITFLRDPVERILSHYRQETKRKFDKIDLKSFAEKRINNGLLNYLGCNSYDLSMHRLIYCFDSFGIVEQYSNSLKLFQQTYSLEYIDNNKKNATSNASDQGDDYILVKEIFDKYNPDELRLYDEALKVFKNRHEEFNPKPANEKPPESKVIKKEKEDKKVSFFDPFVKVKEKVEKLITNKQYDQALKELESVPDETPFRAEVLKDIYLLKGENAKALFWAEKNLSGYQNISDFMNYLSLYRKVHGSPEMYFKVLVDHLALFEHIKSECPDSSLNKNLRTLAQILAKWSVELFQKSFTELTKDNLLRHLQSILPLNKANHRTYWLGIISMTIESFEELSNMPEIVLSC